MPGLYETNDNGAPSGQEIRLYGLGEYETTAGLVAFFSQKASVHGVLLHSTLDGKQWAQLWVPTAEDAEKCLGARAQLEQSGITMILFDGPPLAPAPSPAPSAHLQSSPPSIRPAFPPLFGPLPTPAFKHYQIPQPLTSLPPRFQANHQLLNGSSDYRTLTIGDRGPLPRNLYIVDLPVDLTEIQFNMLFERFGTIEHCKLLSQLDGMGRRRGFILMSTHREALEVMRQMHGCLIDGKRMDISWALVQREARNFGASLGAMPNRVIHPPIHPPRREVQTSPSVIVEGLDADCFPSAQAIAILFGTFGRVLDCSILSAHADTGLTALIQYEQAVSADLLVQSSGMVLGSRQVIVRSISLPAHDQAIQDQHRRHVLGTQHHRHLDLPEHFKANSPFKTYSLLHQHQQDALPYSPYSRLNATSSPFIPHSRETSSSLNQDSNRLHQSQSQSESRESRESRKTPTPPTSTSGESKSSPSACHSGHTRFSSERTRNEDENGDDTAGGEKDVYISVSPSAASHTPIPMSTAPSPPAVHSVMHDRWLSAGKKHGDDKWFKSTAWCKLMFLATSAVCIGDLIRFI